MTDLEKIEKWFGAAVEKLNELDNGDGAFVCLAVGLILFERYYRIDSSSQGEMTVTRALEKAAQDLDINLEFLKKFWNVYRNGFLHQATPKEVTIGGSHYKWLISDKYFELPAQFTKDGVNYICIDPWKFTRMVLNKCRANPDNLEDVVGYRMGEIFEEGFQSNLQQYNLSDPYP